MGIRSKSALDLAVTHLNAPVGSVLTRLDLSSALKEGTLSHVYRDEAKSLLTYLFVEIEPELIVRCVNELRSGLEQANTLYNETLHLHAPRSKAWEQAVKHLL